ncbi:hypothetical protein PFLUV_G00089440 [Perca fluviatilis]|uniref:BHLH domain-containing protein n=1 Tax=Perca fluviatilis TaxID=8168 RepID=A0A6A5F1Q7_PERFL|nr:hypothetical protein PFLUV_G00089440 [Perca fluviatilis]
MKLLQDSEDAKAQRKSLKPQVERRRRERMNRSLESLKTLLLQRQEATQRRVEKAEILEHTVVFLQNTAERDQMRAGGGDGGGGEGGGGGGGGGGGDQKHSFQDGFSTCLQRAAQFLGPEGKGLWLGAALDASFAARFPIQSRTLQASKEDVKLIPPPALCFSGSPPGLFFGCWWTGPGTDCARLPLL